jgi:lysozyme family protein
MLQRALGVPVDGVIGPITRKAARDCDLRRFLDSYRAVCSDFYRGLHQPRFLHGWLNRVAHVDTKARAMIA